MAKVIFEFDALEDKFDVSLHCNAFKMYSALDEIYNMVRSELKHGDEPLSNHIDQLLERIRDECWFIHDLDQ